MPPILRAAACIGAISGSSDESADAEPVSGRNLGAASIAIISDRARQARLRDADQAGGHDHRGRNNRSARHGVVPQPNLIWKDVAAIVCNLVESSDQMQRADVAVC